MPNAWHLGFLAKIFDFIDQFYTCQDLGNSSCCQDFGFFGAPAKSLRFFVKWTKTRFYKLCYFCYNLFISLIFPSNGWSIPNNTNWIFMSIEDLRTHILPKNWWLAKQRLTKVFIMQKDYVWLTKLISSKDGTYSEGSRRFAVVLICLWKMSQMLIAITFQRGREHH